MNNKKNLDKLFKEQLKNFDVAPKDYVWENIEERLHKENRKKRRIIPIWWKIAGIAAGLILLFTVANQVFNTSEKEGVSKNIIVDDTNTNENSNPQNKNNTLEKDKPTEVLLDNNSTEQIANTNTNSNSSVEDDENASINKHKSNRIGLDDNDNSNIASKNSNRVNNKETSNKNNSNTNSSSDDYKNLLEEKKTSIQNPLTKDAVAKSNTSKATSETNKSSQDIIKDTSEIDKILKSNKSDTNTTIANLNSAEKEQSDTDTTTEDNQNPENEEEVNTIENALAEAEDTDEKEEEEEKLNRWSVSPNVAPVYFSSFGEGSPLDNQFVENTKESEINMSYGITGSYAVNKKLKVRAGINKVQLGYKTNDVLIFENSNSVASAARQIANVNLIDSMSQHSIYSARSFKFDNAPATLFTKEQGSLDQQLGFIEVPLEIEYTFIEKKIGLNLIGGFSALFLSDNDVYAVLNNGDRTRLGEASNVKDLSYTANFGIGLDYNFSKQLQFNLEPTFKYQINTFNNTSGDFNPFFIGLYTGLSFKF